MMHLNVKLNGLLMLLLLGDCLSADTEKYKPNWHSLDKHPIPQWYDDAKFGIFIHWGVYSVPSYDSEWFWWHWKGDKPYPDITNFMERNYPPRFSYAEFAPSFKAEFFDPDKWANLVERSGARYVVFTSKHHEGFANWKTSTSWNWNSVDTGPHRNIVAELADAFRSKTNVTFGLYFSLYEWFNPVYLKDKSSSFKSSAYIETVMLPQLIELVYEYKPEYIWSDGDWEADFKYWKSEQFLAWLYNESPVKDTVLVNDRWGIGTMCKHGDVKTCSDHYDPGELQKFKWENAMTIDKDSWGYRRNVNLSSYHTTDELILSLVRTVSCGGNLLLNIGPSADGTIAPIFEERLLGIGNWLQINGEAIYGTKPWRCQNDTYAKGVWYTEKSNLVYAFMTDWPIANSLFLECPITTSTTQVLMLGYRKELQWDAYGSHGIVIDLHSITPPDLPSHHTWTLVLDNIK